MLAEWETRRPYLATVSRECQLWKSAPDAAFESPISRWPPWVRKEEKNRRNWQSRVSDFVAPASRRLSGGRPALLRF